MLSCAELAGMCCAIRKPRSNVRQGWCVSAGAHDAIMHGCQCVSASTWVCMCAAGEAEGSVTLSFHWALLLLGSSAPT